MLIKPPHIAFSALFLALILDYLYPEFGFVRDYNFLGILFFILGLSITFTSFYLFKKHRTPILPGQTPTFVVMHGPYRFTRNPMYLGVAIALLGAAFFIGNWLSLISPIIFFLATNFYYVPREEKLMKKLFGKKYLDYKKTVRRWL